MMEALAVAVRHGSLVRYARECEQLAVAARDSGDVLEAVRQATEAINATLAAIALVPEVA